MKPARLLSLRAITLAVIAAGTVGVVLAVANIGSPLRAPLVIVFLLAAPAAAIAPLLCHFDRLARVIIVAAFAVVINLLVAEVMLAAGLWSPRGSVVVVAVFSVACAGLQHPAVTPLTGRFAAAIRGFAHRMSGHAPLPPPGARGDGEWPAASGGGSGQRLAASAPAPGKPDSAAANPDL